MTSTPNNGRVQGMDGAPRGLDVPQASIFRRATNRSNHSVVLDPELLDEKKPAESEPPRIRCPLCGWSPRKEDKWFCTCGNEWNTFDTGGVCPACLHQWGETQCPACSRWSPHSLWYAHS